jgi:general secretion pathway protein G
MRRGEVRWNRRSGVTILEVLIVLAVIGLIAAVAGPRLVGYLGRAKSETAALQIDQLESAVQLFYIDLGRYPTEAEGLTVLTAAPPGTEDWDGPYIEDAAALTDPWGRAYLYAPAAEGFAIGSLGRDGREGGSGEDADLGG